MVDKAPARKEAKKMFRKGGDRALKDYLRIFGPAAFFTIIGFIVAYQFVQPAPPKQVVIATMHTAKVTAKY
jgi:hypothetical protein